MTSTSCLHWPCHLTAIISRAARVHQAPLVNREYTNPYPSSQYLTHFTTSYSTSTDTYSPKPHFRSYIPHIINITLKLFMHAKPELQLTHKKNLQLCILFLVPPLPFAPQELRSARCHRRSTGTPPDSIGTALGHHEIQLGTPHRQKCTEHFYEIRQCSNYLWVQCC